MRLNLDNLNRAKLHDHDLLIDVNPYADWLRLEIHQTPSLADLSCGLADLLENPQSLASAREAAAEYLERMPLGRDHPAGEAYMTMRFYLELLRVVEPKFHAAAKRWADQETLGWHRLFFATGLLVAPSKDDYWNRLGTGYLVFLDAGQRAKVRELWKVYGNAR